MKKYNVLVGDPFGGYATADPTGLTLKKAKQLAVEIDNETDYFTTTQVVLTPPKPKE